MVMGKVQKDRFLRTKSLGVPTTIYTKVQSGIKSENVVAELGKISFYNDVISFFNPFSCDIAIKEFDARAVFNKVNKIQKRKWHSAAILLNVAENRMKDNSKAFLVQGKDDNG